jgi:hypothetical protein
VSTAVAERPKALCRHGWYDGKQSHVCYQEAGHEPPCKCNSSICGQAVEGEPPKTGTAG